jgi:hypothetical protein
MILTDCVRDASLPMKAVVENAALHPATLEL